MSARGQQAGGGGDNSLDFLWLVALLVVGIYATWRFGRIPISNFVFSIRSYEIQFLRELTLWWADLTHWAHVGVLDTQSLNHWLVFIPQHVGGVDFATLVQISQEVGEFFRIPIACFLGLLAVIIYCVSPGARFKNVYSVEVMRELELENWPYYAPVMRLNLIKADIDEGPWRMLMTPIQFAQKYNLANEVRKNRKKVLEVLPDEVHRTFSLQLGSLWGNPTLLPIHVQALFVAFSAKACGESEKCEKLLRRISRSAAGGKLDFTGIRPQVIRYLNQRIVAEVVYRHAYVSTVMASMLELARTDGVLSSSEFLWLKPYDRPLWYVLNGVGRQTASVEAAGPYAHLLAEKKFGRPIKTPMVKEAVKAFEMALEEILYDPDGS